MKSIDIIIPCFNEEKLLGKCLRSVASSIKALHSNSQENLPQVRVVLVDGGSTDASCAIAESFEATLVRTRVRGRGLQLAEGISKSSGQWILMLHADSTMHENCLPAFVAHIARNPMTAWGIVGHCYAEAPSAMSWVEVSNKLRYQLLGLAFGDQGIFVQRSVLEEAGGMPTFALMEDVELSLRLRGHGQRARLKGYLEVSTRRWQQKGSMRYTLQVISLVSRYLLFRAFGSDLDKLTTRMHAEYYGV